MTIKELKKILEDYDEEKEIYVFDWSIREYIEVDSIFDSKELKEYETDEDEVDTVLAITMCSETGIRNRVDYITV